MIEINFEKLLEYLNGHRPVTMSMSYHDNGEHTFKFTVGKYADNGSRVELFALNDLKDILEINNISGWEGLEGQATTAFNNQTTPKDYTKHQKKMDDLKYGTLSKYIIQMLAASMGKNYFPELKYLKKHEDWFVFEEPSEAK